MYGIFLMNFKEDGLERKFRTDTVVSDRDSGRVVNRNFRQIYLQFPYFTKELYRGYFLKWWANEAPDGYDTISVSSNPWDGATGVYVACDILSGEYEVPNEMVHPFAVVTKDEVENYKDMGDEEIGTPTYDREWVRENLYK